MDGGKNAAASPAGSTLRGPRATRGRYALQSVGKSGPFSIRECTWTEEQCSPKRTGVWKVSHKRECRRSSRSAILLRKMKTGFKDQQKCQHSIKEVFRVVKISADPSSSVWDPREGKARRTQQAPPSVNHNSPHLPPLPFPLLRRRIFLDLRLIRVFFLYPLPPAHASWPRSPPADERSRASRARPPSPP